MEISTEINQIFGKEMANLFAQTIPEEELSKKAQDIWKEMIKTDYDSWGKRHDSTLEHLVKEKILDRLYEKITEILNEPVNDEFLENKAREMVEKAKKVAEESIIRDMAYNMTQNVLSVYGRDENIVRGVLNNLNLKDSRSY